MSGSSNASGLIHDTPYIANPAGQAGYAVSSTVPTSVTDFDVVRFISDLIGRQVNTPWAPPENSIIGDVTPFASASQQTLFAAQGGSTRVYITELYFANNGAANGQFWLYRGATRVKTWDLQPNGRYALTFPIPLRGDA